ncbi:hypothetical protein M2404_004061 [Rheinheimera pacifica]|uniref:hypothetical protein n=1 Tax=Rheinheimera pacifica TaxID=173990 RepID=UPI002167226E|nr:hypothetical protein [Rheinheimera pacifica]MCS4309684.1 hypothetical protein [Rheinheimera pacifica]
MTHTIIINLDAPPQPAPLGERLLQDMINELHWPEGATCVTQEIDGEIIYWNAPVAQVLEARQVAGETKGMVREVGFGYIVHSDEFEELAVDWFSAVAINKQVKI